jgi:Lrp/AsnC family transcriptional regulator, leucine-responsive regulatory protein
MMISFDSERLSERALDETSWRILELLQHDARLSFAEIGRRVNMSSPAVTERVQRLEEAGIIEGYTVKVNLAKVGYPIRASIRIASLEHDQPEHRVAVLNSIPEVIECHRVTGPDCYLVTVAVADMTRLEQVIMQLDVLGRTMTSMILATPIAHKSIALATS